MLSHIFFFSRTRRLCTIWFVRGSTPVLQSYFIYSPVHFLVLQAHAYQISGTKLGVLKSANESLTRVVVYVSLMALYILGGRKVNAVSHIIACIYLLLFFYINFSLVKAVHLLPLLTYKLVVQNVKTS